MIDMTVLILKLDDNLHTRMLNVYKPNFSLVEKCINSILEKC
jgi:hypothetical protein